VQKSDMYLGHSLGPEPRPGPCLHLTQTWIQTPAPDLDPIWVLTLTLGSGIQICHCFWLPRDGSLDTAYGQFDCCAEMAEPIKMLFDVRTWMSPMVGSQISQEKGAILGAISQPIVKYTEYLE